MSRYFRHHNSDFLGMGLVKVAFLWELLISGLDVLISDPTLTITLTLTLILTLALTLTLTPDP